MERKTINISDHLHPRKIKEEWLMNGDWSKTRILFLQLQVLYKFTTVFNGINCTLSNGRIISLRGRNRSSSGNIPHKQLHFSGVQKLWILQLRKWSMNEVAALKIYYHNTSHFLKTSKTMTIDIVLNGFWSGFFHDCQHLNTYSHLPLGCSECMLSSSNTIHKIVLSYLGGQLCKGYKTAMTHTNTGAKHECKQSQRMFAIEQSGLTYWLVAIITMTC